MNAPAFDPRQDAIGGSALIRADGEWPNFHDAALHRLLFDRGDLRPEDDVWIGAWIVVELETLAERMPERIVLKFHDVDEVRLAGFNHASDIQDLTFETVARGTYADGVTPLPPWIRVSFVPGFGADLSFLCFRVEVLPGWPLNAR